LIASNRACYAMPMAASPHPYKVVAPFLDGFLRTEALAAAF